MHLDRNYLYDGSLGVDGSRNYDLSRLFVIEEVGATTAALISCQWNYGFAILADPDPPEIEPGKQCKAPYRCEFYGICNREWPPDDVRSLPITNRRLMGCDNADFALRTSFPIPSLCEW